MSHSEKKSVRYYHKMYVGLRVKYPLFLSGFNESLIFSTGFRRTLNCHISSKPVQWERNYSMRTDRRKYRQEANNRFCLKILTHSRHARLELGTSFEGARYPRITLCRPVQYSQCDLKGVNRLAFVLTEWKCRMRYGIKRIVGFHHQKVQGPHASDSHSQAFKKAVNWWEGMQSCNTLCGSSDNANKDDFESTFVGKINLTGLRASVLVALRWSTDDWMLRCNRATELSILGLLAFGVCNGEFLCL
jgi:hypothetical protein